MEAVLNSTTMTRNEDALRLGMELEQKTIDLYRKLKQLGSNDKIQQQFDMIIEEEEKHRRKLKITLSY